MGGHRRAGAAGELGGVGAPQLVGRFEREVVGQVAERVVGARLVGDDVGVDTVGEQAGQHVGGVAERGRPTAGCGCALASVTRRDRGRVVGGDLVEVAVVDPALQHVRVDVDDQHDAVVHRDRQRLGAAHAAARRR